jgi:hypothetical protein
MHHSPYEGRATLSALEITIVAGVAGEEPLRNSTPDRSWMLDFGTRYYSQ